LCERRLLARRRPCLRWPTGRDIDRRPSAAIPGCSRPWAMPSGSRRWPRAELATISMRRPFVARRRRAESDRGCPSPWLSRVMAHCPRFLPARTACPSGRRCRAVGGSSQGRLTSVPPPRHIMAECFVTRVPETRRAARRSYESMSWCPTRCCSRRLRVRRSSTTAGARLVCFRPWIARTPRTGRAIRAPPLRPSRRPGSSWPWTQKGPTVRGAAGGVPTAPCQLCRTRICGRPGRPRPICTTHAKGGRPALPTRRASGEYGNDAKERARLVLPAATPALCTRSRPGRTTVLATPALRRLVGRRAWSADPRARLVLTVVGDHRQEGALVSPLVLMSKSRGVPCSARRARAHVEKMAGIRTTRDGGESGRDVVVAWRARVGDLLLGFFESTVLTTSHQENVSSGRSLLAVEALVEIQRSLLERCPCHRGGFPSSGIVI